MTLFLYVLIAAIIVLALLWYFVIAPFERRNHARKLEILQQKMKKHAEQGSAAPSQSDVSDTSDDGE